MQPGARISRHMCIGDVSRRNDFGASNCALHRLHVQYAPIAQITRIIDYHCIYPGDASTSIVRAFHASCPFPTASRRNKPAKFRPRNELDREDARKVTYLTYLFHVTVIAQLVIHSLVTSLH